MKRTIATAPGIPTIHVDFTPGEISLWQAEIDAWDAGRAIREWLAQIAATDAKIPRYAEDIIDALDKDTRDKIAAETLAAYQEKKEIRARKP